MMVLVANLGSTSFKFKLFDMAGIGRSERVLAAGAADRVGQGGSAWSVEAKGDKRAGTADLADHAAAIRLHLDTLLAIGVIDSMERIDAIGFKAVHGGHLSDAVRVDDDVIAVMESFCDVAPQHNPPYLAAMRAFARQLPATPQVAAFESGFHQTIPLARQLYGIPHQWVEQHNIRRYGFHGASHRYITTRVAEVAPQVRRLISCHLGGSCSISAIEDGKSVANSFGMTCQAGTFHASRVGDFDTFAILKLLSTGMTLDTIWEQLGKEAGLKGLSGISADMREVEEAASRGDKWAQLAVEAFVESCRHYVGAYMAVLNGTDGLVFTGGIGQYGTEIRAAICANLDFAGIRIDDAKNGAASGRDESRIEAGPVSIWVMPTNEELIVARQTVDLLAPQVN